MDLKTYNEITELLNKKEKIENCIKKLNENTGVLYFSEYDYITLDKQLTSVVTKELNKRLNAVNGALKELNFEVN